MGESKRKTNPTPWPSFTFIVSPPWDETEIELRFSVHKPTPRFNVNPRAMSIGTLIMSALQEPVEVNFQRMEAAISASPDIRELGNELTGDGRGFACHLYNSEGVLLESYFSNDEVAKQWCGENGFHVRVPEKVVKFAGKA